MNHPILKSLKRRNLTRIKIVAGILLGGATLWSAIMISAFWLV